MAIPALVGSLLLLAISGEDIVEMLEHEVEWPTLIFFVGLFMVIAGAEETGLIQVIANLVKDVSSGNLTVAIVIVLWVRAIASAFIDNIPFTATMLPIIAFLNQTIPGAESGVLWWSLALGACLGGNGTMIGASRQRGHRGPGGKGGLQNLLRGLHEGLLVAHDDHRHHLHGVPPDSLLRASKSVGAGIPAPTDPLLRTCYNSRYLPLPVVPHPPPTILLPNPAYILGLSVSLQR